MLRPLRAHRVSRGISQEVLAQGARISKNRVQLLEAGRGSGWTIENPKPSNPRMTTVFGLAEALGVDPAELLRGHR